MAYDYDVIIIGSGVAGMTSAIYLKRAGLKVLIIESDVPGGLLNKTSNIENYPGFKSIEGPTLAFNIYEQVKELDCEFLFDKAISIDTNSEIKKVKTNNKEVTSKFLVIATGRSPRKLKIENIDKLTGRGISYCALCDGNLYKDNEVSVVGGGAAALEEALYLSNICKKVYLINKNNQFKGEKELYNRVNQKENIEIIYNANILKCNIKDDKLESLLLDNDMIIKVPVLFISIGLEPIQIGNVNTDNNYILVDNNYMTSSDNVFACGDIIKKHTYQITTAVGEATNVASEIIKRNKNK